MIGKKKVHTPVILVVGEDGRKDALIRDWCENSRFKIVETMNIFEALEEASDFTIEKCPDVIILETGSFQSDLTIIKELLGALNRGKCPPVFLYSQSDETLDMNDGYTQGDLTLISSELDKIFPQVMSQRLNA
jgi:DNA-binding response OmpR family regulator